MAYIGQNLDRFSIVEKLDVITPATATGAGPYNLTKGSVAFVPASADTIVVSINGVSQYGNFTVNGSTITFSGALTDADTRLVFGSILVILTFNFCPIVTKSDGFFTLP